MKALYLDAGFIGQTAVVADAHVIRSRFDLAEVCETIFVRDGLSDRAIVSESYLEALNGVAALVCDFYAKSRSDAITRVDNDACSTATGHGEDCEGSYKSRHVSRIAECV